MRRDNKSGNVWIRPYRGDRFRIYFRLDGRLHGTKTFDTREEAEREGDNIRRELTTRTRTVEDAIAAYEVDMREREVGEHTVVGVGRRLRILMEKSLTAPLSALTYATCKSAYRAVVASKIWGVGTHHRALEAAKTWGDWCAHRDRGWIKLSPWGDVEHIGKKPDHRDKALRVDDARKWADQALQLANRGDAGAVAALVVLGCNLRPGEVVQVQARDVDDNGRLLHVAGAKLKSAASRRQVEISPFLQPLLTALREGKAPTDRVFPFHRDYVADSSKRICELAGVPKVDARTLRHTYASLMARRGVALDAIGDSMGHADGGKTAKQYYIDPTAIQAAGAAKVAGLLTDGDKPEAKKGARRRVS